MRFLQEHHCDFTKSALSTQANHFGVLLCTDETHKFGAGIVHVKKADDDNKLILAVWALAGKGFLVGALSRHWVDHSGLEKNHPEVPKRHVFASAQSLKHNALVLALNPSTAAL